jgi:hypothetical protein
MAQDVIPIRVEVDRESDAELRTWSKIEGRSKRRHAAIVLRKVTQARKINPAALKAIGLES